MSGMLLRCCWRGPSPALPGAAFATHSNRSCSYQLSNNINKKVDEPHRGCTYGPQGLCRLSQGLSQYGDKYTKRPVGSQHVRVTSRSGRFFFHQFNRERTAFPIHIGIKQRDRERVNSGNLTITVCQIAIYFSSRFTELGGIGKFFTQL